MKDDEEQKRPAQEQKRPAQEQKRPAKAEAISQIAGWVVAAYARLLQVGKNVYTVNFCVFYREIAGWKVAAYGRLLRMCGIGQKRPVHVVKEICI